MSGPLPSRLMFLSDLPKCTPRDKVRFLGCVDEYVVSSGTLLLKHRRASAAAPEIIAYVDTEHVRQSMKSADVQVGSWMNVIGYVASHPREATISRISEEQSMRQAKDMARVHVQALVVWSAGNIALDAYERSLEQRLASNEC